MSCIHVRAHFFFCETQGKSAFAMSKLGVAWFGHMCHEWVNTYLLGHVGQEEDL